ncbi:morphogenetic protein [Edwardsiella piscicida]|uniref:morphogenetic protein n=1 Tax=Edwardsiella piscicida TaxID=1263550 RepID=UPI0009BAEB6D|nr:morphogenetic protein [Edwardsiella piscicida]ARD17569.1 morphogenetic protein [Edwardsiella piscicida]WLJ47358.1 morphogenetic protein [Edwardsiella piscicida]
MKERPIIFNDEMVRAILDGRKTMTRRPMKVQPEYPGLGLSKIIDSSNSKEAGKYFWSQSDATGMKSRSKVFSFPFGKPGDRLWVREAFQGPLFDYEDMQAYLEDCSKFENPKYCEYRADGNHPPEYSDCDDNLRCGWRPSIHMPRWASRILLEITDVRVERLQDITEDDARAEGVTLSNPRILSHRDEFRQLWGDIYGCDGWRSNPWVWVIAFKRVDTGSAAGTSKGE